ncbi:MAG: hypothetical protein ABI778_01060, partial [Ignavibacteriota bacterium]
AAKLSDAVKTLLITDRYSDSSRLSMIKIRRHVTLDKSVKFKVTETIPWVRIELRFDENTLDMQLLIRQLRAHQFVAAEI